MIKLFWGRLFNRIARSFLLLQAKTFLNHGKDHMFFEHIMDPSWDYKPYRHKYNPYFLRYGFKYSIMEGEYYKQMTGGKAARPAVEIKQISSGPVFSKEDMDEIMPEIAKWKLSYECCPMISFSDRKGYRGRISY